MGDFQTIAEQFVQFYYQTFDTNRPALASLYRENSMLSFENTPSLGATAIVQKLTELPFQKVAHKLHTQDAQPSGEHGGILVMVTGALLVDEEQRTMNYVQTFQLMPADGSYYVLNDVFRLIYG